MLIYSPLLNSCEEGYQPIVIAICRGGEAKGWQPLSKASTGEWGIDIRITFTANYFSMVSIETVRQLALSFPETDEHPHFERRAFRVKKKIFATLSEKDMTVSLKLKLIDQSVFCAFDSSVIYPVPGGWGRMGFTFVNLKKVKKAMFKDALTVAYCTTAPPKLAEKFLPK